MALLSASRIFLAVALYTSLVAAAPAASVSPSAASSSLSLASTGTFTASSVAASSASHASSGTVPASSAASSSAILASTGTSTASAAEPSQTVPYASDDPNEITWNPNDPNSKPEAIRGPFGTTVIGPQNVEIDRQNPDFLAPPTTDHGTVANAKWPMGLSHNRVQSGGWARQQNEKVLPVATEMAGVNMRLEVGAVRELHWHTTAEWAYVLKGHVLVSSVNSDGQNYIGTVKPGDLWYFPPGTPHVLQATNATKDGAEFLLVFDSGAFSEDSTFSVTDWLQHVPKEVLAKNFQTDISAFDHIPAKELYIFPSDPLPEDYQLKSPQGSVPEPFTFSMSTMPETKLEGGTVKIVDSSLFKVSKTIAAAEVTVEPGAMRELHWHPTDDEWSFFLEGNARVTLFASSGNARTFDYQGGDVGYVPASFGHYVENIGNTTLKFLEIFKTDRFQDVSLTQWLALTPPELVKAHLQLSDETIAGLSKTKQVVV